MKVVLIDWVDSCFEHGWFKDDYKFDISICQSVGIVIQDSKEFITITQSKSDRDNISDTITIPKVCIKKMKTIYEIKDDL